MLNIDDFFDGLWNQSYSAELYIDLKKSAIEKWEYKLL